MTLILACIAYASTSWINTMPTFANTENTLAIHTVETVAAKQSCEIYRNVTEATLSLYDRRKLGDSLQLYRINTDTLKIEPIKTPTVRLEVDEK